ncbi:MAG: hypothetical protein ACR2N4_17985 [Jatrophihabitans sp.]
MSDQRHCPTPAPWPGQPVPARVRRRSPWLTLGYVLAVIAVIAGLAVLAAMIVAVSAAAQFGSNK